jgi:hypothetical protein
MTSTEQAKYRVGDRLHFRPSPARAPFGTIIGEGEVVVIEVVDHLTATQYSPRFTYVVRALRGGTQGTDDRELTEPEPAARSICRYCGLVVETGGDPDAGDAEWTSAAGPGLTGRRRECHKAPNPTDGPMPGHRPGVIARRPR